MWLLKLLKEKWFGEIQLTIRTDNKSIYSDIIKKDILKSNKKYINYSMLGTTFNNIFYTNSNEM